MNNEVNQNINQTTQNTQVVEQPKTLADLVQKNIEANQKPVDYNSLSPLEKQQLIEKAIKEAELKCRIKQPKGFSKLYFFVIGMIIMCIACVILLNILN